MFDLKGTVAVPLLLLCGLPTDGHAQSNPQGAPKPDAVAVLARVRDTYRNLRSYHFERTLLVQEAGSDGTLATIAELTLTTATEDAKPIPGEMSSLINLERLRLRTKMDRGEMVEACDGRTCWSYTSTKNEVHDGAEVQGCELVGSRLDAVGPSPVHGSDGRGGGGRRRQNHPRGGDRGRRRAAELLCDRGADPTHTPLEEREQAPQPGDTRRHLVAHHGQAPGAGRTGARPFGTGRGRTRTRSRAGSPPRSPSGSTSRPPSSFGARCPRSSTSALPLRSRRSPSPRRRLSPPPPCSRRRTMCSASLLRRARGKCQTWRRGAITSRCRASQ